MPPRGSTGHTMGKTSRKYIRDGRAPIPKKESTSQVMSANKGKDTKPEIVVRRLLTTMGLKGYRLHSKNVPGRPDISFSRQKVAIFVNGCFWHRCPSCNLSIPKSNSKFWKEKFKKNRARDAKTYAKLKSIGWRTIIIWEHEV